MSNNYILKNLEPVGVSSCEDNLYSKEDILEKSRVKPLGGEDCSILAYHIEDDIHVYFVVFDWYQAEAGGKNTVYTVMMHGQGPSSSLRECRHTYWGEEGYIFYPNPALINLAFEALKEWFDF